MKFEIFIPQTIEDGIAYDVKGSGYVSRIEAENVARVTGDITGHGWKVRSLKVFAPDELSDMKAVNEKPTSNTSSGS